MSEQHNLISIKRVKKNGKLLFKSKGELAIYQQFVDSLEEGQVVEEFLDTYKDDGTNMQLAKIHASIRELAKEIGYSFDDMKKEVKRHAGLCYDTTDGIRCKSFGDCSIEELALTIESIIEIGETVGINFRGRLPER